MDKVKLKLVLRTPFTEVLDQDVTMVVADSDVGQVTFLPGHASIAGTITAGKFRAVWPGHDKTYFVSQAVFDLDNKSGRLKVMALEAELISDIELQSVREHLREIEADLANSGELSDLRYRFLKDEKVAVEKIISTSENKG